MTTRNDLRPELKLKALVRACGSGAAAAKSLGLSRQYVYDLLAGKRTFSPAVLGKLGLKVTRVIEQVGK